MSRATYHDQVPLDPGLTVIEASAGTGKTRQITNLVVRLVADRGLMVREIVVVTFTRAATAELRERIRGRLQEAAQALETGQVPPGDDALATLLSDSGESRELWAKRLVDGLRDFDQILISTIHGFCQRMLTTHAFASDADLDLNLVSDTQAHIDTLVDDWLDRSLNGVDAARYAFLVQSAGFTREDLAKLGTAATDDPDMRIEPIDPEWSTADFVAKATELADRWAGADGEAIRSILHGSQDRFKPRTRKYKPAEVDKARDSIVAWLQNAEDPGAPLPSAVKMLDPLNMGEQLIDPESLIAYPESSSTLLAETVVLGNYWMLLATIERVRFAHWVRQALDTRCTTQRLQTYADQLRGLAKRLQDPDTPGARALTAAIGSRYRAALIDEFQDTDAVQWQIFRTLFGPWTGSGTDPRSGPGHHLFLIGDPKQAIYSFRGANLQVYLSAVEHAEAHDGTVYDMSTNWRSDPRLVEALTHRLGKRPGLFGDTRIRFTPVAAARSDRLRVPDSSAHLAAALDVRFIDGTIDPNRSSAAGPAMSMTTLKAFLPDRVAADVVELLEAGLEIDGQAVTPGHMAVLVRDHYQAAEVQWALAHCGVPAVRAGAGNVFHSLMCADLLAWLRAVAEPRRSGLARSAATSSMFGWDATQLDALRTEQPAGVAAWDGWLEDLEKWREAMQHNGVWATLITAMRRYRVRERLLKRSDGERRLADLLQVAELAHRAQAADRLGLASVIQWLEAQRVATGAAGEDAEIRLDRDDDAVTIRTVHASKGLQYPIVFVPYAWTPDGVRQSDQDKLKVADPAQPTGRILDLQLDPNEPTKRARLEQAERAAREEGLRLLYVALTRAEHKCVVYTGHVQGAARSAAASVWHGDGGPADEDRLEWSTARVAAWTTSGAAEDDDSADQMWADLSAWHQTAPPSDPPLIDLRRAEPVDEQQSWSGTARDSGLLEHRSWGTHRDGIDRCWGRHSYSGMARHLSGSSLALDEAALEGVDHDQAVEAEGDVVLSEPAPSVPLAGFPAGADAGTCLHAIFEHIDFTVEQPQALGEVIATQLIRHGLPPARWVPDLSQGIYQVLQTPLGGPLGDTCLANIQQGDRLDELRFDLPVACGDHHRRDTTPPTSGRQLADALRQSTQLSTEYLDTLSGLHWQMLSGFLTGAIDLVFRVREGDQSQRWYVADYKSNRIAPRRQTRVPVEVYDQERMGHQMAHHHYLLQLHLYTVALHRFLRHRISDYSYESHVGGGAYLFIRGMVGSSEPHAPGTYGVFHHRPEASVIDALDQALAGGSR